MSTKKDETAQENNPFMIGLAGLTLLFKRARSVAIFAIVLCVLGVLSQLADLARQIADGSLTKSNEAVQQEQMRQFNEFVAMVRNMDASQIAVVAIIIATLVFAVIVINLLIYGLFDHASGKISKEKSVTLIESLGAAARHIASYLWLNIIILVKILLWSLLFIIPGIIMAVRYSLAGVVFFEEDLRGNAAVKRSLALTKNAWFTTFASHALWNILTLGMIQALLAPGTNAVLYRKLKHETDVNKAKGDTHWLSWATFFVPLALILVAIMLGLLVAILINASTAP